jgi:hypothetical protein
MPVKEISPNYMPITQGGTVPELWQGLGSQYGKSTYSGSGPSRSPYAEFVPIHASRVKSQLLFGNQLEGQRQSAIQNLLRSMQPGNIQANADRMRQTGYNAAISQAPKTDFALRQMGLGSGAREGAVLGGINQANSAANQHLARMNSPEGQQQMLMAILQAIGQGQSSELGQYTDMASFLQGGDQFNKQMAGKSGLLGTLGGLAGMAFSGGWNPFGGGGGQTPPSWSPLPQRP